MFLKLQPQVVARRLDMDHCIYMCIAYIHMITCVIYVYFFNIYIERDVYLFILYIFAGIEVPYLVNHSHIFPTLSCCAVFAVL